MALLHGFKALAGKLQEAALAMSHDDIRARLTAALRDKVAAGDYRSWVYVVAVFGDDKSGNVVYCDYDGDTMQAAYTCSDAGAVVDTENALDVIPLTVYVPEADAAGATMIEAGARHSKADVAMLQTVHDHAVKLGATCKASEAAPKVKPGQTLFVESATADFARMVEATPAAGVTKPLVKIISAGRGSSGYYSKEVLKRDGPKVFKKGTLMYVNHATAAEEAARPEGDWANLAAVLATDAEWMEAGADGPGLYATPEIFSKFAQEVKEKAPWTGVSIRAYGGFDKNALGDDGKPGCITSLDYAESVDLVTKAGRDGKLLLESAGAPAIHEKESMTKEEITALVEAQTGPIVSENKALAAANRKLQGRLSLTEAAGAIDKQHATIDALPAVKARVRERVLSGVIPMSEAGELDTVALAALVEKETKDEQSFVAGVLGTAGVRGAGAPPAGTQKEMTEAEIDAALNASFVKQGFSEAAAKAAAEGKVN